MSQPASVAQMSSSGQTTPGGQASLLGLGAGAASSDLFSRYWNPFAPTRPSHASSSGIPVLSVTPSPPKAVRQSQAPQTTGSQQVSASSPLASPRPNSSPVNSTPASPAPPQHSPLASPVPQSSPQPSPQRSPSASLMPQQSPPPSHQSQHSPANPVSMSSWASSAAAMSSGVSTNTAAQVTPTAPPQGSMGSTTMSTTSVKPRTLSQSSHSQQGLHLWQSSLLQQSQSATHMSLPQPAMRGTPAPFQLTVTLLSNLSGAAPQRLSASTTSTRHVLQSTAAPPHQRSRSSSTTTSTSSATSSFTLRPPQVRLYE